MPLKHDGRFFQIMKARGGPTRVSAVVYSRPVATILMENPNAAPPLPPRFRAALMKVPRFCLDRSIIEWKPGLVVEAIERDRDMIVAAAKALEGFDALGEESDD
jgi:hypothetical protein